MIEDLRTRNYVQVSETEIRLFDTDEKTAEGIAQKLQKKYGIAWLLYGFIFTYITPSMARKMLNNVAEPQRLLGGVKPSAKLFITRDGYASAIALASQGCASQNILDLEVINGQHRVSVIAKGKDDEDGAWCWLEIYHCADKAAAGYLFHTANDSKSLNKNDRGRCMYYTGEPRIRALVDQYFPAKVKLTNKTKKEDFLIFQPRSKSDYTVPQVDQAIITANFGVLALNSIKKFEAALNATKLDDLKLFHEFWEDFLWATKNIAKARKLPDTYTGDCKVTKTEKAHTKRLSLRRIRHILTQVKLKLFFRYWVVERSSKRKLSLRDLLVDFLDNKNNYFYAWCANTSPATKDSERADEIDVFLSFAYDYGNAEDMQDDKAIAQKYLDPEGTAKGLKERLEETSRGGLKHLHSQMVESTGDLRGMSKKGGRKK
jgi:hypothetical protein